MRIRRVIEGRVYEREARGTLSTDETLRVLRVSLRTLRYWVARGRLRPRKVRGRLRFRLAELLRAGAAQARPPRTPEDRSPEHRGGAA